MFPSHHSVNKVEIVAILYVLTSLVNTAVFCFMMLESLRGNHGVITADLQELIFRKDFKIRVMNHRYTLDLSISC